MKISLQNKNKKKPLIQQFWTLILKVIEMTLLWWAENPSRWPPWISGVFFLICYPSSFCMATASNGRSASFYSGTYWMLKDVAVCWALCGSDGSHSFPTVPSWQQNWRRVHIILKDHFIMMSSQMKIPPKLDESGRSVTSFRGWR